MDRLSYVVNNIIKKEKLENNSNIIQNIKEKLIKDYPDVFYTDDLINKSLNNKKFVIKKKDYFLTLEEREEYYEKYADTIKLKSKNQILWNKYKQLRAIPQPVQKSPEWFAARNNMITASAAADSICMNKYNGKYGPIMLLLDKLGYLKFSENENVFHGKKYEPVATMIYEHLYNIKIGEFGLVPHPVHNFIGASPDGIATCSTLDYKECEQVGRMLEIKCPTRRKIVTQGNENKDICPMHYWIQIQQQLECCELEECDFWQCNIKEYVNKNEWLENCSIFDECKYTEGQNNVIKFNDKYKMGVILQFIPINFQVPDKEQIEWYSKYIYSPGLNFTVDEYIKWAEYTSNQYIDKNLIVDGKEYKFDKILYWRLDNSHNYLIKRNKTWFEENLPKFKIFWDKYLYYRDNIKVFENYVYEQGHYKENNYVHFEKFAEDERKRLFFARRAQESVNKNKSMFIAD